MQTRLQQVIINKIIFIATPSGIKVFHPTCCLHIALPGMTGPTVQSLLEQSSSAGEGPARLEGKTMRKCETVLALAEAGSQTCGRHVFPDCRKARSKPSLCGSKISLFKRRFSKGLFKYITEACARAPPTTKATFKSKKRIFVQPVALSVSEL